MIPALPERARTPLVGTLAVLHGTILAALFWMALVPQPIGARVGVVGAGFDGLLELLPPTTFTVVGLVLAARVRRNPIGWLLFLYGLNFAATSFAESYVVLSSSGRPALPFAEVAAWFQSWNWALGLLLLAMALLHFPAGDLPSSSWRWLRRLAALLAAAILVAWADVWSVRFDPSLIGDAPAFPPVARAVRAAAQPGTLLVVASTLVAMVARYRRGGALERLQLRWLSFAVALAAFGILGFLLSGSGPGRGAPVAIELGALLGLASIPVAIGVAVLRYRLYDLGRLVSRTLAYAVVTVVLAAVYALGVLGVEALVPLGSSDLVVAGSTLAVAALFRPVRARVQRLVDRRFDRARYDAQFEVARLAQQLRREVDLDTLVVGIEATVRATLAPDQVSVTLVPQTSRTA